MTNIVIGVAREWAGKSFEERKRKEGDRIAG